jgi:hypothetical protein
MNSQTRQPKNPHKPDADLAILLRTLEKMGIEIRRGDFEMPEGLARVEDRYLLFVRSGTTPGREKELYLDALRKMGPSSVHVPPRVRELLGENDWDNSKGTAND